VSSVDGLHNPEGVASDGHGGVLVSDAPDDRVLHFNGALTLLGDVGSGWARPIGMDLDSSGRLLVADTYANRVLRLDPADSQPGEVGGTVAPALELSLGEGGASIPSRRASRGRVRRRSPPTCSRPRPTRCWP
jgi:hypothetical protein